MLYDAEELKREIGYLTGHVPQDDEIVDHVFKTFPTIGWGDWIEVTWIGDESNHENTEFDFVDRGYLIPIVGIGYDAFFDEPTMSGAVHFPRPVNPCGKEEAEQFVVSIFSLATNKMIRKIEKAVS